MRNLERIPQIWPMQSSVLRPSRVKDSQEKKRYVLKNDIPNVKPWPWW